MRHCVGGIFVVGLLKIGERRTVTARAGLCGHRSLCASWARWCSRIADGNWSSANAANRFSLLGSRDLSLSCCFASREEPNGGSKWSGMTTTLDLAVERSAFAVADADRRSEVLGWLQMVAVSVVPPYSTVPAPLDAIAVVGLMWVGQLEEAVAVLPVPKQA